MRRSTLFAVAAIALVLIGASWLPSAGPRGAAALRAITTLTAAARHRRLGGLLWLLPASLALALLIRRRARRAGWRHRHGRILRLARNGWDTASIARASRLSQDAVRVVLRPRFAEARGRHRTPARRKDLPGRKLRPGEFGP